MATVSTTGLYPFDPYGNNPGCRIVDELQVLQTPGRDDYYFIIPKAAPFFTKSLVVKDDATGTKYVEGIDYVVGHHFVEAMTETGKALAGSIRFLKRSITGVVSLTYQTVGGQWGFDDQAILEELSNKSVNPLVRTWAEIDVLPAAFPPVEHDQEASTLIGFQEVVDEVGRVADAISLTDEGTNLDHISSRSNPHQVTKTQVGLGNVPNYGMASDVDAIAGVRDDLFMSPRAVELQITNGVGAGYADHLSDVDNPHYVTKFQVGLGNVENYTIADETTARAMVAGDQYITPLGVGYAIDQFYQDSIAPFFSGTEENPTGVTKEQVGLGNVPNYGMATLADAEAGVIDTAFMSPYTTAASIDVRAVQPLTAHINDYNNPHNLTADDLGALTETEINTLLTGYLPLGGTAQNSSLAFGLDQPQLTDAILAGQAADTKLFEGRTPLEYKREVLETALRVFSFPINGGNAGKYLRLIRRPTMTAGDGTPLPSGMVAFMISGHVTNGEIALIHLTLSEPGDAVTAKVLNGVTSDLELVTTLGADGTQSVWVKSSGQLEHLNIIPVDYVDTDETWIDEPSLPVLQDVLSDPTTPVTLPLLYEQKFADIDTMMADMAAEFDNATAQLT